MKSLAMAILMAMTTTAAQAGEIHREDIARVLKSEDFAVFAKVRKSYQEQLLTLKCLERTDEKCQRFQAVMVRERAPGDLYDVPVSGEIDSSDEALKRIKAGEIDKNFQVTGAIGNAYCRASGCELFEETLAALLIFVALDIPTTPIQAIPHLIDHMVMEIKNNQIAKSMKRFLEDGKHPRKVRKISANMMGHFAVDFE